MKKWRVPTIWRELDRSNNLLALVGWGFFWFYFSHCEFNHPLYKTDDIFIIQTQPELSLTDEDDALKQTDFFWSVVIGQNKNRLICVFCQIHLLLFIWIL